MRPLSVYFYLILSVADIEVIISIGSLFRPYPDCRNIFIAVISVQPAFNIPLDIQAFCTRCNGVIPAFYRFAVQFQSDPLCIILGIGYPMVYIEVRCRRLCRFFRFLRRFGFCRLGWLSRLRRRLCRLRLLFRRFSRSRRGRGRLLFFRLCRRS